MAKKDSGKSKTNVTARAEAKAKQSICRFCGKKPEVTMVLFPDGKTRMHRKCCEDAG